MTAPTMRGTPTYSDKSSLSSSEDSTREEEPWYEAVGAGTALKNTEKDETSKTKRDLEWLNWLLERKDALPFTALTLRKVVRWNSRDAPEVARLLLQHNTHPIDDQVAKCAADNDNQGEEMKKLLASDTKHLAISKEQLFSTPGWRIRNAITNSSSGESTHRTSSPIENTGPTWDPRACSVCHDLQPPSKDVPYSGLLGKTISWGKLCSAAKDGCKFCSVIERGMRQILKVELCDCQIMGLLLYPLRVRSERYYHGGCCSLGTEALVEFYGHADARVLAPSIGVARSVSLNASTNECMALVNHWLKECIHKHTTCPHPSGNLPTRVVKVGSDQIDPVLHVTDNEQGRYVALSHCWGKSAMITTTTATIEERKRGISISSLPKTFHDAIIITRSLGIEYLWIDSLCILQDSTEDWAREAARMAAVYSEATVVIAADASASSADGCFGPYRNGLHRNLSIAIPCVNNDGYECTVYARHARVKAGKDALEHHIIKGERYELPIASRGWCLQERLLAPRILHYCFSEVVWECRSKVECECSQDPNHISYSANTPYMQYRARMLGNMALPQHVAQGIKGSNSRDGEHWYELVKEFTQLDLTYHSDRLAALSGLAARFQGPSDQYIGGLWRSDVVRGLMWCIRSEHTDRRGRFSHAARVSRAQDSYQAPSWSWGSVTGEVEYPTHFRMNDDIEILDIEFGFASANPFGSLDYASLTVRGCLLPVLLDEKFNVYFHKSALWEEHALDHQDSQIRVGKVNLDVHTGEMASHEVIVQKPLFITILQRNQDRIDFVALVLRGVGDSATPDTLQRIGCMEQWFAGLRELLVEVAADTTERRVFRII